MQIDPNDLLDSADVAELLHLSSITAVATYRARYEDFPEPLVSKGSGRCLLWLRTDIEAWIRAHPRRRRPRT